MAKSVGIDPGEFEVKVVELDGSYRKPRLTKFVVEAVAAGAARAVDETHAARQAEATLTALEEGGFAKDNLSMAFPCRESVLRALTIPFVGEDQIRKVIKFEAEGSIHSHNVDDMVVDFHVLQENKSETRVLIAAVPKPPLRTTLQSLERAGIEPVVVSLDTMALFQVAEWCGAFDSEAKPLAEPGEPQLPAAAPPCRLVLDLGARSTRVLVVVNRTLVDMRALRIGSDAVAEEIASSHGIGLAEARDVVWTCLRTGADYAPPEAEAEGEGAEANGADDEAAPAALVPVAHAQVRAAHERYLSRLRQELVRFLTSVPAANAIEAVWITGGASVLPGVEGTLESAVGVAPQRLELLARLSHRLDEQQVQKLDPKLAVALGLALQSLSGRRGFNFRQEDLAFTKGFDRIKFPLAVTCMLALFLVLVFAVRLRNELNDLKVQYGMTAEDTDSTRRGREIRKVMFHGYVGSLVNPPYGWFATARYFDPRDYTKVMDKLVATDTFRRLPVLKEELKNNFAKLQQESGYYAELRIGSGLGAIVEISKLLKDLEPRLGRYLLTSLDVKLQPQDQARYLEFMVALRSDETSSFREKGDALLAAVRARCGTPASSFLEIHKDTGEKDVFQTESGEGYYLKVRLVLKPEGDYVTFPPKTATTTTP